MQHYSAHQGLIDMEVSCFLQKTPAKLLEAEPAPAPRPSGLAPKPAPRAKVFTFAASERVAAPARPDSPALPFAVGTLVQHKDFGQGKVMGYKGETKILVHFERFGLKILLWEYAGLSMAGAV
jgi:DNA helicase-2/ATP-dependent DNA helicase PcrA